MNLIPDMKPACKDSGLHPDAWFPDIPRGIEDKKRVVETSLMALAVCSTCPIRQACLNYALSDSDALAYGIYGGTLPYERLEQGALQWNARHTYEYQRKIRAAANGRGLTCPPISMQIKPNGRPASDYITRPRNSKSQSA